MAHSTTLRVRLRTCQASRIDLPNPPSGIAYQLTPDDPLVNTAQCKRDIVRMSELGTNAVRVYHVDASADHQGCMTALADAGIYVFVDLDTFTTQIEQVRSVDPIVGT